MSISSVHNDLAIFSGIGSALTLFGIAGYFMSYQYQDFSRVQIENREEMELKRRRRRNFSRIIQICSVLVYLAGLVLLVLSIGLYRNEKEEEPDTIPDMIKHKRATESQPSTNEPVLLSSLATVIVLAGTIQCIRHFNKTETFGAIGMILYAGGWIANAFAASMQNNSIQSVQNQRLAWTLPGVTAIVIGTIFMPWEIKHQYVSGPSLPFISLGLLSYSIGNTLVLKTI